MNKIGVGRAPHEPTMRGPCGAEAEEAGVLRRAETESSESEGGELIHELKISQDERRLPRLSPSYG